MLSVPPFLRWCEGIAPTGRWGLGGSFNGLGTSLESSPVELMIARTMKQGTLISGEWRGNYVLAAGILAMVAECITS